MVFEKARARVEARLLREGAGRDGESGERGRPENSREARAEEARARAADVPTLSLVQMSAVQAPHIPTVQCALTQAQDTDTHTIKHSVSSNTLVLVLVRRLLLDARKRHRRDSD